MMGNTAMRYDKRSNDYYRDGGNWSIDYKIVDDKLISVCNYGMPHLNGIEMIPISEKEWRKNNGQYAPKLKDILEDLTVKGKCSCCSGNGYTLK